MATEFVTPVGRIVQGDPVTPQDKDSKGNPLTVKTGPNKGKPTQQYFIAVAFRKDDPAWPAFYGLLYNEGRAGYPQMFDAQGNCTHPRFTFKIMDGDGVDNNGQPNNQKEGFAGHWVVKFSSGYAPKLLDAQGNYINEPDAIKRGYYVRVFGNCSPNIGSDVPGVYVNHTGIQLCGYGQEIIGGPDVAAAFKAAGAFQLPPGASAQPLAPVAMPAMPTPPGGAPGMPRPPGGPGAMPMPPQQPAAMPMPPGGAPGMPTPPQQPGAQPAPNYGFVNGAMQGGAPAGGPPMMQPPAAPQYVMTPAANGYSREEWHRSNYTDEMLLAQGIMIRTA